MGRPRATVNLYTQPAYQAQADAYAQQAQQALQSKLDNFRWYPVVQLGLVYRF